MIDAHNHLHQLPDPDLALSQALDAGVTKMIINGTSEQDWHQIANLCKKHNSTPPATNTKLVPAFGLHPWQTPNRSPSWLTTLEQLLLANPDAHLGECGLDRWKKPFNLPDQITCLHQQTELATRLNRPLTIHCLQAWGPLLELLESLPPIPPFLLHAYSGSPQLISRFTKLGSYFSFNGYFLHKRKSAARQTFQQIPLDRLLLETDAPAMLPPPNFITHPLPDHQNHPANLPSFLAPLAKLRRMSPEALASQLNSNFNRLNIR
ncbi:MAG: TatD family hydrolase [Verrucomicrobiota bacterium]